MRSRHPECGHWGAWPGPGPLGSCGLVAARGRGVPCRGAPGSVPFCLVTVRGSPGAAGGGVVGRKHPVGEGRGGNPAAAWGPEGQGSLAARLRADSPATGSPKTPAGMGGDTVPGEGLCPLPPGLLSVRSPWPQDAPGSGWGAWPLSSSAARPAATGLGRRACLMAWMGDGFQGEISSSVESLLFAAAHKMSSRRPARRAALQSHLNLLPFPP